MVPVVFVDNEIEAELARARLESEGIRSQVRFSAKAGYPRIAAGFGGAPLSTYEVLVRQADVDEARRILAENEPPEAPIGATRRRAFRWLALALLVVFVAPLVAAAIQQVRLLF